MALAMEIFEDEAPPADANDVCAECQDNESHAAHFAAFQGHLRCLEILVERHAEDVLDPKGRTPLFYAAARNHPDCCALLADVRWEWLDAGDNDGDTPLHVSACRGHHDVVQLLLQSGAQAALANTAGLTAAHVARKSETLELLVEYVAARMRVLRVWVCAQGVGNGGCWQRRGCCRRRCWCLWCACCRSEPNAHAPPRPHTRTCAGTAPPSTLSTPTAGRRCSPWLPPGARRQRRRCVRWTRK